MRFHAPQRLPAPSLRRGRIRCRHDTDESLIPHPISIRTTPRKLPLISLTDLHRQLVLIPLSRRKAFAWTAPDPRFRGQLVSNQPRVVLTAGSGKARQGLIGSSALNDCTTAEAGT